MIILRKCNCHIQNLRSETKLPVLFVCNNIFYETDPTIVPCQVWNVNRITSRYDSAIIDRQFLSRLFSLCSDGHTVSSASSCLYNSSKDFKSVEVNLLNSISHPPYQSICFD